MPEVHPKPTELVQAQIAAFATERVEHPAHRSHIIANVGNIAVDGVGDVTRVSTEVEYSHRDEKGQRIRVPAGTEMTAATASEYTDFLREVGGSKYEPIRNRAEMLTAYAHFEPTISRLKDELAGMATPKQHPNFLGNGLTSKVFLIEEGDKKYAVRIPNDRKINAQVVEGHLAGAALGKDLPHLEQIVAASYEDGVTVAEVMPGKDVSDLTLEDVTQIGDEHLSDLVDTLITANEHDIDIDPKPSNFFFDLEAGYGIVDNHSAKVAGKNSKDQTVGDIVGSASLAISNAGIYGKDLGETVDDYAYGLKLRTANLDVLRRYRAIVTNKLDGEERLTALKHIEDIASDMEDAVADYSNPEWVAENIARNQELRRQKAERSKNPHNGWATASGESRSPSDEV